MTFDAFVTQKIRDARHTALALGITPELALLRLQWTYVNQIAAAYPEIGAARGLCLMGSRVRAGQYDDPEPLNMETVETIRWLHGIQSATEAPTP